MLQEALSGLQNRFFGFTVRPLLHRRESRPYVRRILLSNYEDMDVDTETDLSIDHSSLLHGSRNW